jgi:hypothetical protein
MVCEAKSSWPPEPVQPANLTTCSRHATRGGRADRLGPKAACYTKIESRSILPPILKSRDTAPEILTSPLQTGCPREVGIPMEIVVQMAVVGGNFTNCIKVPGELHFNTAIATFAG